MNEPQHPSAEAHKILHSVERMLDRPEAIVALVERYRAESRSEDHLCQRIVSHYSNRSALAGGVSSLPGMLPGAGTIAVAVGATFAEMAVVLKLEVEMCIALAAARGFDIHDPSERQLAFLLAAVRAHEVERGRNVLLDVGGISMEALLSYSPREVEKMLLHVLAFVGLDYGAKRLGRVVLRALPFVGIGLGAGMNKVLTARVGERAHAWLALRAKHQGMRR